MNAALCEYHYLPQEPYPDATSLRKVSVPPCVAEGRSREEALCPAPSLTMFLEAELTSDAIGTPMGCHDTDARCADWAARGECDANAALVRSLCPESCDEGRCQHVAPEATKDGLLGTPAIQAGPQSGSTTAMTTAHAAGSAAHSEESEDTQNELAISRREESSPAVTRVVRSSGNASLERLVVVGRRSMRATMAHEQRLSDESSQVCA